MCGVAARYVSSWYGFPDGRPTTWTDPTGRTAEGAMPVPGRALGPATMRRTTVTRDSFGRITGVEDDAGQAELVTYDSAGRLAETRVDGRTQVAVDYHEGGRRVVVRDYTHPAGAQVTHEVVKDRRGLPVARTTTVDGKETRWAWTYDRDGLLTEVSLDGDAWRYEYDAAGRLTALVAPSGARAEVSTDHDGRVRCVDAGFTMRAWDYRQGFPVRMEVDGASEERTYDAWGRLAGLRNGNGSFVFTYDAANQLTGVTGPEGAREFSYDPAGRLVRVAAGTAESTFAYDRASRLAARITPEGKVAYTFDTGGRRVATQTANAVQRIEWDGRGWPSQVKLTGVGTTTGTHENNVTVPVWVNGLGEPTELGGSRFDWNIAAPVPQLMRARGARVWHLPGGAVQRDGVLPKGVTVAGGRLSVDGMGWMGARLADLASFAFVSPDPAVPAPGSLWEANTYNLLGNNPLNLVDPWGTAPITDADLSAIDAYNENRNNAGQRWANIIVGIAAVGVMAVGAAILAFNPATLAGMLIVSAVGGATIGVGSSVLSQIVGGTNVNELNWKHIGVNAALGAVSGVVGGVVGRAVDLAGESMLPEITQAGQGITETLAEQLPRNALSSGVSGAINGSAPALEQVSDGKGLNSRLLMSGMATGAVAGLYSGSAITGGGAIASGGIARAGFSEAVSNRGGQLIGGGIAGAVSGGVEYAVTSQLPGAGPYSNSDFLSSLIIGGVGGGTPGYEPASAEK